MRYRKYTLNKLAFNEINPESAYWLGFIYGDGSVTKNSLRLELNKRDIQQLENFNLFMESDNLINNTAKDCCLLIINDSKILIPRLNQLGIIHRKSHNYSFPLLDNTMYKHFYRGLIDADGWIVAHKSNKGRTQYEFGLCSGHLNVVQNFQDYIKQNLELRSYGKISKTKTCYQLIIGGNNNFLKISSFLEYNNYYSMPRKLDKINSALLSIVQPS